ncbi:MAG: hypothetical protein KDI37_18615 [Xanthomonadales bacterium]|nr:hypothetical protein [Xanthomonadales bacterium]
MSPTADAFLQRWRQRDPAFALAQIYARSDRFAPALGLYFELQECLYRLSERRLAESKLGWWLDEAAELAAGQPRHPLTQALAPIADAAAASALITATARQLDAPTPANRAALVNDRAALLQALQALLDDGSSALVLGALDDVYRLASLGQGGADLNHPLSLAERARLPATREELVAAPARAAEARRDLAQDWLAPVALGEASPALAVQIGLWRQSLLRRGIEPTAGPLLAWRGWRMARKARGQVVRT